MNQQLTVLASRNRSVLIASLDIICRGTFIRAIDDLELISGYSEQQYSMDDR